LRGGSREMLDIERRQKMMAFIEQNEGATVGELSRRYSVHESTVRRDLIQLSKDGLVERGHGGAAPRRLRRSQGLPELPVLERAGLRVSEKQTIGRAAARYVEDGDVILINGGTTTAEMVPFLDAARDVTVITNGLHIASLLAPLTNIKTVITGGVLRNSELSMLGALTEDALHNLRADKLFMSSPAIHVDYGFSADDMLEVESDRNMMASAKEIFVLADHTKFGNIAMMRVAPIERVRRIITDSGTAGAVVAACEEQGVEVEVVSTESSGRVSAGGSGRR
jgi:DeoR family transcriptional regulator, aga operon transcriptional repressor